MSLKAMEKIVNAYNSTRILRAKPAASCHQAGSKQPLSKGCVRCIVFGGNVNNITFSLVAILIIFGQKWDE